MVKKGEKGAKPNSLADLYGSVWIGAGAGSVLLLYGAAGDPIVEMLHLKTPAEEVGPYRLRHDHEHGRTEIFHSTDLLLTAQLAGSRGLTAKQAASVVNEKGDPTPNEIEKARRALDKLVQKGLLERTDGSNTVPSVWRATSDDISALIGSPVDNSVDNPVDKGSRSAHAGLTGDTPHGAHTVLTGEDVSAGQGVHASAHGVHGAGVHVSHPLFKEGGNGPQDKQRVVRRAVAGQEVLVDLETGEVLD